MMNTNDSLVIYLIFGVIGLTVSYFLFRWIFGIDKRVHQNNTIINLLIILAKKQGATNEEIHGAITHD